MSLPLSKPQTVLDLIGRTPMARVQKIDTGVCELYLKLENQNPGGSIKDRIALSMIDAAEKAGQIKPGDTLIEATAGNTGLGLALIAAMKGYKLILVVPDKMSREKIFHMKAMGADVIMTRSDVGKGHSEYYQDIALRIAAEKSAFYINQFENPSNPLAHELNTAPEIFEQMEGRVDAIVCGVGSGGTLTGIGRYFANTSPDTQMILADPVGSILAPLVNDGVTVEAGSWLVEGIGEDFVPDNCNLSLVKKAYAISDRESIQTAQDILHYEGILCGSSSGTLIAAALKYCREQTTPKRVVTFVCDSGNKYLSKIFNPFWLEDQGITSQKKTHTLRDLIARPYVRGDVIAVKSDDTLKQVYAKMKSSDVSQVPVIENDQVIGLIDETDVLMKVVSDTEGFSSCAGDIMNAKLDKIDVNEKDTALLPIFQRGHIAIVTDQNNFLGLITPIDFLNHLRQRTGHS